MRNLLDVSGSFGKISFAKTSSASGIQHNIFHKITFKLIEFKFDFPP